MSGLINMVKDAISSVSDNNDTTSSTTNTNTNTNASHTHSSAEPRIDSTQDQHATYQQSQRTHDGSYTEGNNYALGTESNRGTGSHATQSDGPHKSNLLNKLDPRVDSDNDRNNKQTTSTSHGMTGAVAGSGSHAHTSRGSNLQSDVLPSGGAHEHNTTGTRSTHGTTHGTAGSNFGTSTTGTGTGNVPEGTYGQHNSRIANAVDPRIDSDHDGSRTHQSGGLTGATGTHNTHGTTHGSHSTFGNTGLSSNTTSHGITHDTTHRSHGTHGNTGLAGAATGVAAAITGSHHNSSTTGNVPEGTYGQHNSRIANAADPRVDSDHDSRRTYQSGNISDTAGTTGGYGSHGTHGATHGTTGSSFGTGTTGSGNVPEGTYGQHNSRIANAADPRIDSDHDSRRDHQSGGLTGSTGTHHSSSTGGNFSSSTTTGTGSAHNTAGPHKSDLLNKVDPRVDSDRDGSKTYGGDKTYEHKDPRDAAQVPPSVMQKVIGKPVVEHEDESHDRDRRHSTHNKESHFGL